MDINMTFGNFLKEAIKKQGLTQQNFYESVGIGKPYFYDIASGKVCPPPADVQMRMINTLTKLTADEKNMFYDIASRERKEVPTDIAKMLFDHPSDMASVRKVLQALLITRSIRLN
ncbi:MAG: helix-turn-helix transcriptional regulator [Clostridia bacterium]|nr:helix-turn-helix transcriptional regulator [Clostridia bacterium]